VLKGFLEIDRRFRLGRNPPHNKNIVDKAIQFVTSITGYTFRDSALLMEALTHASYFNEVTGAPVKYGENLYCDNERLEFLGDAVIGLVVARTLMERFRDASEGLLSRWRSELVSRKTLAEIAVSMSLGTYILLGKGENSTGGTEKRSILAAVFESLVGAIYLDGGLDVVTTLLMRFYEPLFAIVALPGTRANGLDSKTLLQEKTQALFRCIPSYQIVKSWGPEHNKSFHVQVVINEKSVCEGMGRSKKEAEQAAARVALEIIGF
jgi:ribonuclease-3